VGLYFGFFAAMRRFCPTRQDMDMRKTLFTLAVLWTLGPPLATAQAPGSVRLDPSPTLQASLPATPVPPVQYRSALDDLPKGVEQAATDWKAANATTGQFKRGHADLLQWEQDQARKHASPAAGAQP
jgi:hypothetical protein